MENNKKKTIPVFFAADEKYAPYLAVTLASIKAHASEEYFYKMHVLTVGKHTETEKILRRNQSENFKIYFHDVTSKRKEIEHLMHCRDYYTSAIYFRLFIPELFPEYEKAVYLDCDTVVLEDIAHLYNTELGENLIGAVADQAVASVTAFREYVKNALGITYDKYFNSGVIVMNLKKMREIGFYRVFNNILNSYDFIVAPDQDCLNLICKNKVVYLAKTWNTMPIGAGKDDGSLKLIHYNLALKPWHYDGILYENYFWDFAKETPFFADILKAKESFTKEDAQRDQEQGERLLALAQAEADSPCNYLNTVVKPNAKTKKEGGRYGFNEDFTPETGDLTPYRTVRTGRAF